MGGDVKLTCQDCLTQKFTVTWEYESGGILIECADCTASRLFLPDWIADDPGF